ncbi:MAG: S-formylglutathione hydrolase [Halioglobus sp.]
MELTSSVKSYGGQQRRFHHQSDTLNCGMDFSIYLPPQADEKPVPVIYWLSGLTCTDEIFPTEAGGQQFAAKHGVAIVCPDTSPRGEDVADEPERYDLGKGAGFYVNATQGPWSSHFQMFDYVNKELPELIEKTQPVIPGLKSIFGHSMGGHGALISSLKNPGAYRSTSAFAPISHPTICPWGKGCFETYLGNDEESWKAYDATELIKAGAKLDEILIDQGAADELLAGQLYPEDLKQACDANGIGITLRMQPGYDHGYHFIASFIGDHIAWHAEKLGSN